jgi:ornithine carbamoyltransferase
MSDLIDLVPTSDTIDVNIVHPVTQEPLLNDDGTQMTITIFAPHTKEYKSQIYKQAQERMKKNKGKTDFSEFSFEDLEESSIELFVNITKDWNVTFGGKQPKFSKAKAKEIYTKVFWIKPQVEEAIANYVDFTKA